MSIITTGNWQVANGNWQRQRPNGKTKTAHQHQIVRHAPLGFRRSPLSLSQLPFASCQLPKPSMPRTSWAGSRSFSSSPGIIAATNSRLWIHHERTHGTQRSKMDSFSFELPELRMSFETIRADAAAKAPCYAIIECQSSSRWAWRTSVRMGRSWGQSSSHSPQLVHAGARLSMGMAAYCLFASSIHPRSHA